MQKNLQKKIFLMPASLEAENGPLNTNEETLSKRKEYKTTTKEMEWRTCSVVVNVIFTCKAIPTDKRSATMTIHAPSQNADQSCSLCHE